MKDKNRKKQNRKIRENEMTQTFDKFTHFPEDCKEYMGDIIHVELAFGNIL